ncbi:MAG TPA: hypothetical protein VGT06_09820 [Candidatus Methylomirabilis sp.]|jgi:translation initiation factor 2B subunit (eIF-2B alpha/beta/delta family)|nr:hypothetical protein [Candidatus Methylomirabilis sp.]
MHRISTAVTTRDLLRRLQTDERRGAGELASLAARYLDDLLAASGGSAWEARLRRGTAALLATQPAMAPLFFLANALWLGLEGPGQEAARRVAARAALARARAVLAATAEGVARVAARLTAAARTIVTISSSSTVLAALTRLAAGHPLHVIVGEGRPALEGRRLARSAARVGCRATLVADAALPGEVRRVDAVLLGADAVLRGSAINKVGTYPLLLAARDAAVPSYLLADGSKLVPDPLAPLIRLPVRDPRRLWRDSPPRVAVARTDFEMVPLSLLSAVVTDEGPMAPAAAARRCAALPAARFLRQLARRRGLRRQRRAERDRR